MTNLKLRKPATWFLVTAFAGFSLAAVACADTSANEKAGRNDDTPAIGAPSGVVGNISSGGSQGSSTSSNQIEEWPRDEPYTVASGYDSAAIAPLPIGASGGFGQAFNSSVGATNSGIWVTGQGTIEIPADIAQVSIGVESRETTVSAARQKAADAMGKVLDAIKENGVSEEDIVTTNFNIYPQTIWVEVSDSLGRHSEPRITGYTVSNTVQVTVRDIDNLSRVVDTASTAGGDLIRINSIQFTVDDSSAYGEIIRQYAGADALAKADVYARAMGVTLGQLVYLSEISSSVPMSYGAPVAEMAAMDRAFKSTPISSGDMSLSVTVQAVFAIGG
ncbi:MAG: SIMPL domain-containing protein [Dehalococcoidia bacterium]|nr:SIMPL domain-containing protein [Dehalococcoidia bacterium]